VTHGQVEVNGHSCNIPSMLLRAGDTIRVKIGRAPCSSSAQHAGKSAAAPDYSNAPGPSRRGRVSRLPTRQDVDPRIQDIREQLIIEFCSR